MVLGGYAQGKATSLTLRVGVENRWAGPLTHVPAEPGRLAMCSPREKARLGAPGAGG